MLNNTAYKLKNDKKLRIVFFGGSITDGTGSSDHEKTGYRALTTEYFRKKYPDADITSINAAIGGTGTSFGMFRMKKDVLDLEPDLVFVEFAVNDFGDTADHVIPQTETMLRQARKLYPMTDVILLVTTAEMVIESLANGEGFESRDAQEKVACHYGVPAIRIGETLEKAIAESSEPLTYFIPDTLHPGDIGHKILADALGAELNKMLDVAAEKMIPHVMPEKLDCKSSDGGDILYVSELEDLTLNGFTVEEAQRGRFERSLICNKMDGSFTFTFEGTGLGVYRADGDGCCDLIFTIDGGEPIVKDSWDRYVRSFHRLGAAVVTKELVPGKHTVKVTAVGDEPYVVIGGMFVC